MRVLLAEDDELLGSGLKAGLQQQGFQIDWVRDGVAAERELLTGVYEAAVLDLGLPRQDGMQCLVAVRRQKVTTPVLILTARDGVPDRIAGLDAGADDYLVKPVDLLELAARLRALVRRAHGVAEPALEAGALRMDLSARQVSWCGRPVDLSQREYEILQIFMLNLGRVLTRSRIEEHLYQWGAEVSSNTVEVHIYHLRKKLRSDVIETLRGVGYVMPKNIQPDPVDVSGVVA
ncbi:DNA-binding response regulator [Limnohabitans sp. 2KL-1]|jgi:DNA-binding response OmpR family regulator|uniref:winged helix-turn-helix domain-containing protein n=1 Tax=Limnohabitans sp. 2KL-1 TaxID=1100699 RepID=UPI000D3DA522|nr:winged helix-turn-helix domain-containing protein [Limnohabitans sp. 2KL-1]PUE49149.1 DNA-binding response regulator [Limnohabitans sp. 2KL-1]